MLAFTLLITFMVVGIRFLSDDLHPFEIAFFRNLFGLAALVPLVLRNGVEPLKTKRIGLLSLRGALNGASLLLFFLAVTLVLIADIAAYSFTTPLFVSILAVLFLAERMGPRRWTGLAVGFLGAMVILRPGAGAISVGALYVLGSAAFWALTVVTIKVLSRTEASVTTTFYGGLILIPITFVAALFFWTWPSVRTACVAGGAGDGLDHRPALPDPGAEVGRCRPDHAVRFRQTAVGRRRRLHFLCRGAERLDLDRQRHHLRRRNLRRLPGAKIAIRPAGETWEVAGGGNVVIRTATAETAISRFRSTPGRGSA
jgi:uncharacterized membrane protein